MVLYYLYILINFQNFTTIFLHGIESYQYPHELTIRRCKKWEAAEQLSGVGKNIRGGQGWAIISEEDLEKISQCRKPTQSTHHYLNTLPKIALHRGEDPSRLSGPLVFLKTWGSSNPLAVLLDYLLLQKFFFQIVSEGRKLSNSVEKTLSHILIHLAELYPILKNWAELCPILIDWRNYTLTQYIAKNHCRNIPYPNKLRTNPKLIQKQILVGSQTESGTKNRATSSANQNRVS